MSSTPQPKRRRRALWTAGVALAALLTAAGTALAAVAALPATSPVGSAGYEATTANPAGFTNSQAVINADQYALTIKNDNAQGVFLCDTGTGLAAQAGEVSTNLTTTYAVVSVLGKPSGGCPNQGIAPGAVTFPGLATVPFGHHVWTNILVTHKVKVVRVLICILRDKDTGRPVPTPTASVTNPTAAPSPSVANPTASAESPSESPSVANPTASPSESAAESPTVNPADIATTLPVIPGVVLKCRIVTKVIQKAVVTFEAQDLDAPTVTPHAGDLAGVQTRTVHLPRGTVFDSAGAGVTGNLTALVPCSGGSFPLILAGPAAYTSRSCQPLNTTNYATASIGGGAAQDYGALNTTEVIAPNASAAVMAPNNSLNPVSVGPHGTASDASTTGSQFNVFSGNAPTS